MVDECLPGLTDSRHPDRGPPGIDRRQDVDLVVVQEQQPSPRCAQLLADMVEDLPVGLDHPELERQERAVEETDEGPLRDPVEPVQAVGVAQAGHWNLRAHCYDEGINARERPVHPAAELCQERIRAHLKGPIRDDPARELLRQALAPLEAANPLTAEPTPRRSKMTASKDIGQC